MEKLNHTFIISIGVLFIIGNLVLQYNKMASLPINPLYVIIIGLDVFYLKKSHNLAIAKYHQHKISKL